MRKHYTHRSQEERYQIYAYKKAGFPNALIAQEQGITRLSAATSALSCAKLASGKTEINKDVKADDCTNKK